MKTAGIAELKASLSEYLAKVKAGEEVLITERGKPIARIAPLKEGEPMASSQLLKLKRAGLVKTGTGKLPPGFWKRPRCKDGNGLAVGALLEEREESR